MRTVPLALALMVLFAPAALRSQTRGVDPAALVVRIQRLEEEVARLRGRVEELEYALRRQEARLRALEEGRAGGGVAAAPVLQDVGPQAQIPLPPAEPTGPQAQAAGTGSGAPPAGGVPAPVTGREVSGRGVAPRGPAQAPAGATGSTPRATVAAAPPAASGSPGTGGSPAGGWPGPDTGPAPEGPTPDLQAALAGTPEERYRRSLALLEAGSFDEAAEAFSRFLEDFPKDPRAADAAFWLAETHFFRRDYATAAQLYARNYRTYGPDSPRAPDNLLKLGMALAAIGERERACRTFAELERRHPRAPAYIRQQLARERAANRCE